MLFLEITHRDGRKKKHKLYKRRHLTIGRWRNNHIILEDPTVSGHHARIESDDDEFFVLNDLNSRNGTYVNDQRIVSHELLNGDIITMGKCTIVYRNEDLDHKLDEHEAKAHDKTLLLD